ISLRVIADHLRATTFLVGDGVLPGNEGRGYVLRKIMRRAMLPGKKLGMQEPFLYELTAAVAERMKGAYPELVPRAEPMPRGTRVEEDRFEALLKNAIPTAERSFEAWAKSHAGKPYPGEQAFELYDTYGLPLDLVEDLARERGLTVERAGFESALARQQERARQSSKMGVVKGDPVYMELLEGGK